jgi:hypothetical protein
LSLISYKKFLNLMQQRRGTAQDANAAAKYEAYAGEQE